jgi:hypothetical protein
VSPGQRPAKQHQVNRISVAARERGVGDKRRFSVTHSWQDDLAKLFGIVTSADFCLCLGVVRFGRQHDSSIASGSSGT